MPDGCRDPRKNAREQTFESSVRQCSSAMCKTSGVVDNDKTCVHHYTRDKTTVEAKRTIEQWVAPNESAPKKAKTVSSAGKVMATVFWDARGIILIDYLQKS